jgi:Holliday junction resolvase-like predicted endonuclease
MSRAVGAEIEERALQYLLQLRKLKLLDRNRAYRSGELDLIFEGQRPDGEVSLVFVEVRFRSDDSWETPMESIGKAKRKRLTRAIQRYLASYEGRATEIEVHLLGWDGKEWEHFENVWLEER